MAHDDAHHEHEWGLVVPFTVVTSVGGPYDDPSYVAGYEAGVLDARLEHEKPPLVEATVRTDNLPQIDLVAMRRGYLIDERIDAAEWTMVRLMRLDIAEGVTG